MFSDQQEELPPREHRHRPTAGGIPLAGNPETIQRASVEADMQRGMSTNPGGVGASGRSGMGGSSGGSTAGTNSGTPDSRRKIAVLRPSPIMTARAVVAGRRKKPPARRTDTPRRWAARSRIRRSARPVPVT
ncbi:MAG: hypothetical protein IPK17_39465 [Chloroflexi bacterium]|uniref:hypothetical protein n=1 Tax=Candidatus Flexifilum breve TaxID=3140694 RepID=UPI0031366101|nr:hypothetical protein [Chloroflexota bacterium]